MSRPTLIVGAGFAARQLIKQLRKLDAERQIVLVTADSGDDYNKPELSHVISQGQTAQQLTRQSLAEFAKAFDIKVYPFTPVTHIDTDAHQLHCGTLRLDYAQLVLATGASAIVPPIVGSELMLTLNSQEEYRQAQTQLKHAQRIFILGGGLIGTELAMDIQSSGKQVMLADQCTSLLAAQLPVEISAHLQQSLMMMGVELYLNQGLKQLVKEGEQVRCTLDNGRQLEVDAVISAIGLKPNIVLAQAAGIHVNKGIVVNAQLQTNCADIYALGDCAEIDGKLHPYLQPIQLSALVLAKTLVGHAATLTLPAMLVRVKTPRFPIQFAGNAHPTTLQWQVSRDSEGIIAKGMDETQTLRAFVVSEAKMSLAFTLLKTLTTAVS